MKSCIRLSVVLDLAVCGSVVFEGVLCMVVYVKSLQKVRL